MNIWLELGKDKNSQQEVIVWLFAFIGGANVFGLFLGTVQSLLTDKGFVESIIISSSISALTATIIVSGLLIIAFIKHINKG